MSASETTNLWVDVLRSFIEDSGTLRIKLGATGLAMLFTALVAAANHVLFAALLMAWALDMASGSLVAGWKRWSIDKALNGVRKMSLGVIGVMLGVILDAVVGAVGPAGTESTLATNVAMFLVFVIFFTSAAKNVGTQWPGLGAYLERAVGVLGRSMGGMQADPDADREPLPEPSVEEIEATMERRRGNPPAPGATRGGLNGTDN